MGFKKEFDHYYSQMFGDIELSASLFYKFPIAIRFTVGINFQKNSASYVNVALDRANSIFNELFNTDDELFIIVNSFGDDTNDLANKDISVVRPLIKDKFFEYNYIFSSKEDDWECKRFIIKSIAKNIDIQKLLEAIVWSDIDNRNDLSSSVFLINTRNSIVYYLYDDRGLDVASVDKAELESVYRKYNDWILDYDREKIDNIFSCRPQKVRPQKKDEKNSF